MKAAYFHCFSGVSGDMILGALIDCGLDPADLLGDLRGLGIGFRLTEEKVLKRGIRATRVRVSGEDGEPRRRLADIQGIINGSALSPEVKGKSLEIFSNLALAEAKIHGVTPEEVHFHEVGAVDAIVDIVGAVIGLDRLGVEEVWASPVNTGEGFVKTAHGILPVPAPATLELFRGALLYSSGIERELATPTGAAILSAYARGYGSLPRMRIGRVGYGAGELNLPIPNVLRLIMGEKDPGGYPSGPNQEPVNANLLTEEAVMVETNIDDMNPELYDYLFGKFLREGAMDVFLKPIQMKKNRPAVTLSVLCAPEKVEHFCAQILAETTSLGVRTYRVAKYLVPHEIVTCETEAGTARAKIGFQGDQIGNIAPEYEDCRRLAEEKGLPLKAIYDLVRQAALDVIRSRGINGLVKGKKG